MSSVAVLETTLNRLTSNRCALQIQVGKEQDMVTVAVKQCCRIVVHQLRWQFTYCGTMNQQVDDIFNKVGYDPKANAQTKRQAPSADGQGQGAGDAGSGGLPRMDLSTLLEKVGP